MQLSKTTAPVSALHLARRANRGSDRGIRLALARLVEQGLVLALPAGNATLYALNAEHLAAPAVRVLAGMRKELFARIRGEVGAWQIPPGHVSIFGSAARRQGDTASDIDLLVVRPRPVDEEDDIWRGQVDRLSEHIEMWTGNAVELAEIDEQDVARLRRDRPAIVSDLEHDAVDLGGLPARELLRTEP